MSLINNNMNRGIRSVHERRSTLDGSIITGVTVIFGPHFMLRVREEEGKVKFSIVATHHGIEADATEVGGDLDKLIWYLKGNSEIKGMFDLKEID